MNLRLAELRTLPEHADLGFRPGTEEARYQRYAGNGTRISEGALTRHHNAVILRKAAPRKRRILGQRPVFALVDESGLFGSRFGRFPSMTRLARIRWANRNPKINPA